MQPEFEIEVQLVDIIHFFVERGARLLVVMVAVSILFFCGVIVKKVIAQNVLVNESEVASDAADQNTPYKAMALIELAQILLHGGEARPIMAPNLLIGIYKSDQVMLSVYDVGVGGNPSNSLWVSAENDSSIDAETLVKNTAEAIVADARLKEQAAGENANKAYSVIGTTRIVRYQLIEPLEVDEPKFEIKVLFKTAFLSLIVGIFASLLYAGFCKVVLDYRKKYSST
ncbi:hypothetical protein [Alkalimarinus alittae]|uniref:Polysaccharide chain length determinant N-terminal domain-containing protein n=1 Tax=Alkalimarinus alittae TaxID=2961619 RepID=A0ABY6MZ49_9ALTE|nr:hypothetical protein [Alkalimarinus alittae]UZE95121.1 hypothetical protein NKI27_13730 [Alkalimarinus alittae]